MFKNANVDKARQVFTTRLGYIISVKVSQGETQRSIANSIGVGPAAIGSLKNRLWTKISLNYMLVVADRLGLEYALTLTSKKGKQEVTVSMPSYDKDPAILSLVKRG